jgi:hypothetical protein
MPPRRGRIAWRGIRSARARRASASVETSVAIAALSVDPREDQREPDQRPADVADRRGDVVVHRGERAREQPGGELAQGRGHQPGERRGGRVARLLGAEAGQHGRERLRRQDPDECERQRGGGDRARVRGGLDREAPLLARPCEGRQHGHADGRRGEREHDEDPVRREEPVRLGGVAELLRDDDADDRRETRLDGQRESRDRARGQGPVPGRGCTLAHRRRSLRTASATTVAADPVLASKHRSAE